MEWSQFIPPTEILIWGIIFNALAFESQRLFRLIDRPALPYMGHMLRGLIGFTGLLGLMLSFGALLVVFFYGGWQLGVGFLALVFLAGLVASTLVVFMAGGDSILLGVICTLAMYPAGYNLLIVLLEGYF